MPLLRARFRWAGNCSNAAVAISATTVRSSGRAARDPVGPHLAEKRLFNQRGKFWREGTRRLARAGEIGRAHLQVSIV
jgi:hypothetical protein